MARIYFLGFTVAVAAFVVVPAYPSTIPALALFIGVCMAGAMTSIYAMTPVIFPREVRAGGTGIAIGIGRIGGAAGPYFTGVALTANAPLHLIYVFYAIPSLIIALMLYAKWAVRINATGVGRL
jgi:nitrate/nitrite transporter NarK